MVLAKVIIHLHKHLILEPYLEVLQRWWSRWKNKQQKKPNGGRVHQDATSSHQNVHIIRHPLDKFRLDTMATATSCPYQ